jgi:hypothetical protein
MTTQALKPAVFPFFDKDTATFSYVVKDPNSTACAVIDAVMDIDYPSGTISFRPSRFEGGGMRYLRFARWLAELDTLSGGLGRVVFEEVRRHAGTDAAHIYGGFLAHLAAWCESRSVAYEGVPVGTIKRFATGKGNADKAAVIAAIQALGFRPADDNEADALAILALKIEGAS